MKTTLLIALLTLFSPLAHAQESDEAKLTHIKTVLWPKAYAEQDTALLNQILADEFQSIDDQGIWSTKSEELDWVAKNKINHEYFVYEIKRLDIIDNHTAIVSGIGNARGTNPKGKYSFSYHSSNVFIKREGNWVAVASHVSGIQRK